MGLLEWPALHLQGLGGQLHSCSFSMMQSEYSKSIFSLSLKIYLCRASTSIGWFDAKHSKAASTLSNVVPSAVAIFRMASFMLCRLSTAPSIVRHISRRRPPPNITIIMASLRLGLHRLLQEYHSSAAFRGGLHLLSWFAKISNRLHP